MRINLKKQVCINNLKITLVIQQKNRIFTIEQNIDNNYIATIKVFKQENVELTNKDSDNKTEYNLSFDENHILIQSQIELYPEDVMVLRLFSQVKYIFLLYRQV